MSLTLHVTHVTNHLTKQLFTRLSALGVLYFATLVNVQTPFPFQVVWNMRSGHISSCSLPFRIAKAKLAFSSLIYGNDEVLLHRHFNLTSPPTSEPVAIIRAALHNRSLCLFIFNFRDLLSFLIFGEWGRIKQPVHTFRPLKLSCLYRFNRNINGDVSCRSVN